MTPVKITFKDYTIMIKYDNEFLASIINNNNDSFFSCDLNGIINTCNAAAEGALGYANEDAIGRYVCFIFYRTFQESELELLIDVFQGKRISYYKTTLLAKQGRQICAGVTLSKM